MSTETRPHLGTKEVTKLFPVNSIGEILVGVRALSDEKRPGELDFIGGGREDDDCCSVGTGVRELYQETGLIADHAALNFVDVARSPSGNSWVSYYRLSVVDDIEPNIDRGELEKVMFMSPREIYGQLEHEGQRQMLASYIRQALDLHQLVA